jgi:DsbC/DsbD-like thiol-disulfide interchange protein
MFTAAIRRSTGQAIVIAAALIYVTGPRAASAADASPWSAEKNAAARLIAGAAEKAGVLRAGVELKLAPGWKTYWRYPGDSGVPPRFDFSRSRNLQSATVLWPAPHRASDASGSSIGYSGAVVFPLRIIPQDPAQPVVLDLALDYAICEKLCVPLSAHATLALGAAPSPHDSALAAAEASVPRPRAVGEGPGLTVRAIKREGDWPKPRYVVDVAVPGGGVVDLFAEGPDAGWALPIPEPVPERPAGVRRFEFAVDGVPPEANPRGARVTLTAVSGSEAIEVRFLLD